MTFYIGSLVGLLPEMFFYTLIGHSAKDLVKIAKGELEVSLFFYLSFSSFSHILSVQVSFLQYFMIFVLVTSVVLSLLMGYYGLFCCWDWCWRCCWSLLTFFKKKKKKKKKNNR